MYTTAWVLHTCCRRCLGLSRLLASVLVKVAWLTLRRRHTLQALGQTQHLRLARRHRCPLHAFTRTPNRSHRYCYHDDNHHDGILLSLLLTYSCNCHEDDHHDGAYMLITIIIIIYIIMVTMAIMTAYSYDYCRSNYYYHDDHRHICWPIILLLLRRIIITIIITRTL
jgi:hypothetical protein